MMDPAEREEQTRSVLLIACKCRGWHWFRNDDGFMECRRCGVTVDE